MHIRVITPIVTKTFRSLEDFDELSHPGLKLSHQFIDFGPASIECELDETLAAPDTAIKIITAEKEGADAVVIDCLGDPGMKAGREAVRIPVVGAGEASMYIASMLGHRFSIITTLDRVCHMNENQIKVYGIHNKFASCRAIDMPVLDLESNPQDMALALIEIGVRAIREDGAHVLLFGCTGMSKVVKIVSEGLLSRGFDVPVIEPLTTAIRFAELLLNQGYRFSGLTYPPPPLKEIIGYQLSETQKIK